METEIKMETDIKFDQQTYIKSIAGESVVSKVFFPQNTLNTKHTKLQSGNPVLIKHLQNFSFPSFAEKKFFFPMSTSKPIITYCLQARSSTKPRLRSNTEKR